VIPHRERANGVTAVLPVDPIYHFHEVYSPLAVNSEQQALLPLGVGHDVGEEDSGLVVDEPRLVAAFEQ
jgi:hypothetical protein